MIRHEPLPGSSIVPNPSYAPKPSADQVKLIDDFGGPKAVADAINERLKLPKPMTGQCVSNWKRRGIPFRFRGTLVVLAQAKGVNCPEDFFGITAQT